MTEREQYQGPELDKIKNDVIEQTEQTNWDLLWPIPCELFPQTNFSKYWGKYKKDTRLGSQIAWLI